jgi:hypothetical protein
MTVSDGIQSFHLGPRQIVTTKGQVDAFDTQMESSRAVFTLP